MKNNKGFSLVELIVVIAIMAILAAVAVVGYSVYIERAQDAADEQYLSDVVYRAELFAIENQIPLQQVVVAPVVDGAEDIMLIIGWDADRNPIYYDGDTSEIWQAVGNATLQGGLNNGTFVPGQPDIEIPDEMQGAPHTHTPHEEKVPSTCKTPGTVTTTCTDPACNYKKVVELPLGDHNYPQEPNAEQGGFAYYVCADCGKIVIKSTGGQPIVPIG
jgi:prepilin-type N-terminal cleavage/methylation domain-containing protein